MDMIINGEHIGAKETFEVLNPATLEIIDSAPRATPDMLDQAVVVAKTAFKTWRQDEGTRRKALEKCAGLIREHLQEIAQLLVKEQGKPLAEATGEMNAGQTCLAVKRVYAHENVYPELVSKLTEIAKAWKIGSGLDPEVQMGPVNNKPQLELVEELLDDARKCGGQIRAGGEGLRGMNGHFLKPTIVTGGDDSARIVAEGTFGPALPILSFQRIEDAVERANATHFGLGASVWSSDVARASAVAEEIDAGTTWVNQHVKLEPDVPFGGQKQSGVGREMGIWGLEEFCDLQVLSVKKK